MPAASRLGSSGLALPTAVAPVLQQPSRWMGSSTGRLRAGSTCRRAGRPTRSGGSEASTWPPKGGCLGNDRSRGTEKTASSTSPGGSTGLDALELEALIELAHVRWVVERFYQDAKGELGMDDYEGRFWTGLHRHLALVMLAHSFLTLRQSYGPQIQEGPPAPPQGDRPLSPPPARGFPPVTRRSIAALRRTVLEELFAQVIDSLTRTRAWL